MTLKNYKNWRYNVKNIYPVDKMTSGVLFHQNKFFPIMFIRPNIFFPWLRSFLVFLFNRCLCPCPLHDIFITYIHILYVAFWMLLLLLFPCCTFTTVLLYSTITIFVWRNTFVINTIAELFIMICASARTKTTSSTAIPMIIIHIRTLMQFMLKRKKAL